MTNYVRTNFCVSHTIGQTDLIDLSATLFSHGCHLLGPAKLNMGNWYEQLFVWKIQAKEWKGRFFHLFPNSDSKKHSLITFDIDEFAFFSEGKISYKPNGDPLFAVYQAILVDLIKQMQPEIGIIDYDADLLCDELIPSSFSASWGNYFSNQFLETWSQIEKLSLQQCVDDFIPVGGLGYLTFIHPLQVNQAWSDQHEQLNKLIGAHLS